MYEDIQKNYQSAILQDDVLASKRFVIDQKQDHVRFYEFEPAVVLDVVLDESHPIFSQKVILTDEWPRNIDGSSPTPDQKDYSWIGRIKFRFVYSQKGRDKETLFWALPLENTGVVEYPLMNEVVSVVKYLDEYYYTSKINLKSVVNSNGDFSVERRSGLVEQNINEYTNKPYDGPVSTMNSLGGSNYQGVLGNYFKFNPNIRTVKRYEGDLTVESRFGSSIRFGSYDDNRSNDSGLGEYADKGGNPYTLIRNRQAKVPTDNKSSFSAKGYVTESINNDGSSIHLTSGKTISDFLTTCQKVLFQNGTKEEQPEYSPDGSTSFKYPKLDGDQIVINSDRLIFSSKANETFHYSKKRLAMVTDDEFTIDAHKQVVVTTNEKVVINSPKIFLGAYDDSDEPVLLGRTSTFWLYQLCTWMINQTELLISQADDWHSQHVHVNDTRGDKEGPPDPAWAQKMKAYSTQLKEMRDQLTTLRDSLPSLMSDRVFTVGGGGSPGYDGGNLK